MEKMVRYMLVVLVLFHVTKEFPQQRELRIPQFVVLAPEEVNDLTQKDGYSRSLTPVSRGRNNIETTIEEVEELIKSNPSLPRLTRGEILDLLENITKSDIEKLSFESRNPKAIMVVMPYTPSNSENNMEDLYTKPPVTQIIGSGIFKSSVKDRYELVLQNKTTLKPPSQVVGSISSDASKRRGNYKQKNNVPPTEKIIENQSGITTERQRSSVKRRRPTANPTVVTPNTTPSSSTIRTRSRRPHYTTMRYPNHRYREDEMLLKTKYLSENHMKITESPEDIVSKYTSHAILDLYTQENKNHEVALLPQDIPGPKMRNVTKNFSLEKANGLPLSKQISVPDHLTSVVNDMNLDVVKVDGGYNFIATSTSSPMHKGNIKTVLSELDIHPSTTTTTLLPDVSNVVDSLSPEMRNLLENFGLLPNEDNKFSVKNESYPDVPERAEVKADSYLTFKPLPQDESSKTEIEELLAKFGLGRGSRKLKSLPKESKNASEDNFDVLPDTFKRVIPNISFQYTGDMKNKTKVVQSKLENHVSKLDQQYTKDEEFQKLQRLLEMIKQLEVLNGNVSKDDLKKIDFEDHHDLAASLNADTSIVGTLNEKSNGPSPLDFDSSLSKNELKRQESATLLPGTPSTTEPKAQYLTDLEDSFGAPETITETTLVETTTLPRKTGFYYLADWNTFFEIDDQKGKRVNLRFQPTIGDPKRFLSVSVP